MTTESRLASATNFDDGSPRRVDFPGQGTAPDTSVPSTQQEADTTFIHRVLDKVEKRRSAISPLHYRMDADYAMWRLDPFRPNVDEGIEQDDAYTSNTPRNVADKITSMVGAAKRLIRIKNDASQDDVVEANNNAERLAIGMLDIANRRLVETGKPALQDQLAWMAVVRGGWIATRALLTRDALGETKVDITPIDGRNLMVQFGADEPIWAAIVTLRNRAQIHDEYPDFEFNSANTEGEADTQSSVTDYYWWEQVPDEGKQYMNAVIIDTQFAKRPTNTFATRFPIVARAVGSNPIIANFDIKQGDRSTTVQGIEDFGESIFAPIRAITRFKNRMTTYSMALTAKTVQGIMKVYSADGTKELPEGALVKGDAVSLSTLNQEELALLDVPKTTQDAQILLGIITDDENDGTLPPAAFGILQGAESGRALQMLRSNMGERVIPRLDVVQAVLKGSIDNLFGQYKTNQFEPLKVRGRTFTNEDFDRFIKPEDIQEHGEVEIKLLAELPQDRQEKMQIATMAAQRDPVTGLPIFSHKTIWDEVLEVQDSSLEMQRIHAELASTSSPRLSLALQLEAAVQEGDRNAAFVIIQELETLETDRHMQEIAKQAAFAASFQTDPNQAAVDGPNGPQGEGGGGRTPQRPTAGLRPETSPLSGTPLGAGLPNPNPGNATNDVRQRAAAINIEVPTRF